MSKWYRGASSKCPFFVSTYTQSIKKGSDKTEIIEEVIEKYSKGLSSAEQEQIGKIIKILGKPQVKPAIKNMGIINDFMKRKGLRDYQLSSLFKSKDFNKILEANGNDIYKALFANETKKLISNIVAQGVSLAGMIGLTKGIESYLKTKSEKTQRFFNTSPENIEKINRIDDVLKNNLDAVKASKKTEEVIDKVDTAQTKEEKQRILDEEAAKLFGS